MIAFLFFAWPMERGVDEDADAMGWDEEALNGAGPWDTLRVCRCVTDLKLLDRGPLNRQSCQRAPSC